MLDNLNILRIHINKSERVARGSATARHEKYEQHAHATQPQPFNKFFHLPVLSQESLNLAKSSSARQRALKCVARVCFVGKLFPMSSRTSKKRRCYFLLTAVFAVSAIGLWAQQRWLHDLRAIQIGGDPTDVAALARWPWPNAKVEHPARGVTHWRDSSSGDGTVCELIEFDFKANPNLRFAMWDQDGDDAAPWDNHCGYWPRGAAQMTRQLNGKNRRVVALWNGSFFGYHGGSKWANKDAFHVSPVVVDGVVHSFGANHRWSFGVKYRDGKPVFSTFHQPSNAILKANYDFGTGGVQCLIRDGKPLQLRAYGLPALAQPVNSTDKEAGHIPDFDWMKSSRASIAWNRQNSKMWLLFVKEGDSEGASIAALKVGGGLFSWQLRGGWSVADVQKFWQSKGVWNAINSDAGDVAQLCVLRPDRNYDLVPPRQSSSQMRLRFGPDFQNAPGGGALMYFYVAERT